MGLRGKRSRTRPFRLAARTRIMALSSASLQQGLAGWRPASSALISSVNDGRSRRMALQGYWRGPFVYWDSMLIKIRIDPVAFTIRTLKVHWYGIMIAIGLYAGYQGGLAEAAGLW